MRYLISALSLALLSSTVHAQHLKPTPEAGLWQVTQTTTINGKNLNQGIIEMQEGIIARQPADKQAMLREVLVDQDPATSLTCASDEDLAEFTDRRIWLADFMADLEHDCTLPVEHFDGNRHEFRLSCNDIGDGLRGEITNEKRIINPQHMVINMHTVGIAQADLTKLGGPANLQAPYDAKRTEVFTWLGPDCGDITD